MAPTAPAERFPLVITGPTASGKGALSFALARRLGGEIVSLDSMKVFRELDVATAKPAREQRQLVAYHLIDRLDPGEDFSVAEYLRLLDRSIEDILARGKVPVIAGGTALYLKAYLEGLQPGPGADWSVRERLESEVREVGLGRLHERLRQLDPGAAQKIHVNDARRIVRALEVVERTGEPLSRRWAWSGRRQEARGARCFALDWDRAALYRRIDQRVERMVAAGLFEEAQRLRHRQPPPGRAASQAIGYKEIWAGLDAGLPHAAIVAQIQRETRRFAKSQLTWFRKMPIEWLPATAAASIEDLATEVLRRLASPAPHGIPDLSSAQEPGRQAPGPPAAHS
jgi:tRNA dimethylallyltransferase